MALMRSMAGWSSKSRLAQPAATHSGTTVHRAVSRQRLGDARIEDPHDVLFAPESAERQAAGNGLAHGRQVGLDAVLRLPAADVQAVGDRLVEYEQGAVVVSEPQGRAR